MNTREWVFYTEDQCLAALPEVIERPQRRVMWTILQFYWDDPAVHFELQPSPGRGQVEVGLHFECTPEQNEALAARVARHACELQAVLGPEWELEEWTASWRRLHRVYHSPELNGQLARDIAAEWCRAMTLLWPFARLSAGEPAPFYVEAAGLVSVR